MGAVKEWWINVEDICIAAGEDISGMLEDPGIMQWVNEHFSLGYSPQYVADEIVARRIHSERKDQSDSRLCARESAPA